MKKEELEKEKSDIHSAKTVCDQVEYSGRF